MPSETTERLETVGDYIRRLQTFPEDWRVMIATPTSGDPSVEHREVNGKPVVAVFGSNGGRFGNNPLTEDEYRAKSKEFLDRLADPWWAYTTCHGDHRLYHPGSTNDTCYGTPYDERIIERMVTEGALEYFSQPYQRDGVRRRIVDDSHAE